MPDFAPPGTTDRVAAEARLQPRDATDKALQLAGTALGIVLLSACGGENPGGTTPSGKTASSPQGAPKNARKVDEVAAEQLIAAILDECHKPLQRRMQQVKIRVTLPAGRNLLVQADLPDLARITEGRRNHLWRDQTAHRLGEPDAAESEAEQKANRELIAPIVRIVDAAAFGPLYRAKTCTKSGDHYVLTDAKGTKTELRLFQGTLLPRSLSYAGREIHINDYRRTTKTTWIVSKVTHAPLGTCDVFFEDGGILIPRGFFDLPSAQSSQPRNDNIKVNAPGVVRERESTTPIVVKGSAARWVLLPASSDWQQRHERLLPVHEELVRQNQRIFGFPMYWQQAGEQFFAVPFRQREGGAVLRAPADWQLSGSDQTKMLVVYPDQGNVNKRIETGTALLQRALTNRRLKAIGPIVAQPFVHLQNGPPTDKKLNNCKVRMSVRVQ